MAEPRDCTWCGSAKSIEFGLCQVCLMAYPEPDPEVVIKLPDAHATRDERSSAVQSEQERPAVAE